MKPQYKPKVSGQVVRNPSGHGPQHHGSSLQQSSNNCNAVMAAGPTRYSTPMRSGANTQQLTTVPSSRPAVTSRYMHISGAVTTNTNVSSIGVNNALVMKGGNQHPNSHTQTFPASSSSYHALVPSHSCVQQGGGGKNVLVGNHHANSGHSYSSAMGSAAREKTQDALHQAASFPTHSYPLAHHNEVQLDSQQQLSHHHSHTTNNHCRGTVVKPNNTWTSSCPSTNPVLHSASSSSWMQMESSSSTDPCALPPQAAKTTHRQDSQLKGSANSFSMMSCSKEQPGPPAGAEELRLLAEKAVTQVQSAIRAIENQNNLFLAEMQAFIQQQVVRQDEDLRAMVRESIENFTNGTSSSRPSAKTCRPHRNDEEDIFESDLVLTNPNTGAQQGAKVILKRKRERMNGAEGATPTSFVQVLSEDDEVDEGGAAALTKPTLKRRVSANFH